MRSHCRSVMFFVFVFVIFRNDGVLLSASAFFSVLMDDFLSLRQVNDQEKWRLQESLQLGDLVQRRLNFLQVILRFSIYRWLFGIVCMQIVL